MFCRMIFDRSEYHHFSKHPPLSFSVVLIIIHSLELFTSALADGFTLESEWQQVSSSLQDFSQYSVRSQQCYRLHGLHSSAVFHVL